jgi:2,4-dienoyl-CoA reductase-like NADH-dependent reductase (Old Yellow Enzyme family)
LQSLLATFNAVRARVGVRVPIGIRISQGKVNDYHHKWADAERDAEIIFGSLAEAGADFIHVTGYEAWQPAFTPGGPSLMRLAKRHALKAAIFANGGLHNIAQAVAAPGDGADIVTIARGALAKSDLPRRLPDRRILNDFDPATLAPSQHGGKRARDVKATRLPRNRIFIIAETAIKCCQLSGLSHQQVSPRPWPHRKWRFNQGETHVAHYRSYL